MTVRNGNRDILVRYSDARHTLYVEALIVRDMGSDNEALKAVVTFIQSLSAGRAPVTFGYEPDSKGNLRQTPGSRLNPKVHLALQYLIRNYFRIEKCHCSETCQERPQGYPLPEG